MSRVVPLKFIKPQLASPVDQPPEGKHWIHEINSIILYAFDLMHVTMGQTCGENRSQFVALA